MHMHRKEIFEYIQDEDTYHPRGKSGLLNVTKFLKVEVTKHVECYADSIIRLCNVEELKEHVPFTPDLDTKSMLCDDTVEANSSNEEPFNVESIVK